MGAGVFPGPHIKEKWGGGGRKRFSTAQIWFTSVFLLIVANILLVVQVSLSLIFKTLFDTHFQIQVCLVLKSCLYSFSPGERGREGTFRRRGVGSGSN